jgi:predicted DNA-binding protein
MSRGVSIRFTEEVLEVVDSCIEKTGGNRSSFVRDACLAHAQSLDPEVCFVKLSQENVDRLKNVASQMNMDHDAFLDQMLTLLFEEVGDNPLEKMQKELGCKPE